MSIARTINPTITFEQVRTYPRKDKEFEIHTLEWLEKNRPFTSSPQRLSGYEIFWVKNGCGSLLVDLQDQQVHDHTIYCLMPGQLRCFRAGRGIEGYYISLSEEFLHLLESQINISFLQPQYGRPHMMTAIGIDEEMQIDLEDVVVKMMKEYRSYFHLRSEVLKGFLRIFMIYLSRNMDLPEHIPSYDKDTEMFKKFTELLKQHYTTRKLVTQYADELCVTPSYLNSVIKKISGFPASHHIQQHVVLEAKRQAMYSNLRMKEIASALGFEDCAHFSKYFKNYAGVSFTNFKKRISVQAKT